jgi:hypothetical protein
VIETPDCKNEQFEDEAVDFETQLRVEEVELDFGLRERRFRTRPFHQKVGGGCYLDRLEPFRELAET